MQGNVYAIHVVEEKGVEEMNQTAADLINIAIAAMLLAGAFFVVRAIARKIGGSK